MKTKAELDSRFNAVAKEETNWKNKKRGYEGEIGRWKKEVSRHKTTLDNYSALAETKD